MQYAYQAKGNGGLTAGTVEADSVSEARRALKARGLFTLSLEEATADTVRRTRRRRISRQELLTVTSQLAVMVQAGVDLGEALRNVSRECTNPRLKATLQEVFEAVSDGMSVTEAVRRQSDLFGEAYAASIAAGEASGTLPTVLDKMTTLLKNEIRLRSSMIGVIAYPCVLLGVAGIVLFALLFFILPRFREVFRTMGAVPPLLTQVMLSASELVRDNVLLLLGVAAAMVVVLVRMAQTGQLKRLVDTKLLTLPLIGPPAQAVCCGRMFRLMGTLFQSGVPLLEAIRLCRNSTSNVHLRALFDQLDRDVVNGKGLGQVLIHSRFVPRGAAQMVATAEASGSLGSVLHTVGEYYETEGEQQLGRVAKYTEPALILFMGALVAAVVCGVMLPLLDVTGGVQ